MRDGLDARANLLDFQVSKVVQGILRGVALRVEDAFLKINMYLSHHNAESLTQTPRQIIRLLAKVHPAVIAWRRSQRGNLGILGEIPDFFVLLENH